MIINLLYINFTYEATGGEGSMVPLLFAFTECYQNPNYIGVFCFTLSFIRCVKLYT